MFASYHLQEKRFGGNRWKHQLTESEVRQVLRNKPRIRFYEKGEYEDEHVYGAFGQTDEGRYVVVFYIQKTNGEALVITARDMTAKEKKRYGKK